MQATRGGSRSGGVKSKRGWSRQCCHGTCKTNNRTCANEADVFFISFPKPCLIYRNNEIARILSRPDDSVPHAVSECQQCSKVLRWISLCKRHEPKAESLTAIVTKNTYICSKHFINPHPIHGPSEDHPDPFNASEEKIQKLKNSKRKRPSDRSAIVVQKKTREVKDTLPQCVQEDADSPNHSQNVENNSTSESLLNSEQEELSPVNNIEMSESTVRGSRIPLLVLERLRSLPTASSRFESVNLTSETGLEIDVQEGVSYPLNLNSADEDSNLRPEIVQIPAPDVDDDALDAQNVVTDDNIFSDANYGSLLPEAEAKDTLETLVTKYGKLHWFTNFDADTASFLKLSEDHLPLFIIKVTENIGEANFSYELFMFNQIFPVETAELDGLDQVEAKLKQMSRAKVCRGISCEELKNFFLQRQMLTGASVCAITGGLRSHNCRLFAEDDSCVCVSCTKYSYHLRHLRKKSEKGRTEPGKFTSNQSMSEKWLRKKLAASATLIKEAKKKIRAYEKRVERLTREKKELQNNNNNVVNGDLTSIFFEDSD